MTSAPIVVHCCHCSWCQRETSAAFYNAAEFWPAPSLARWAAVNACTPH